MRDRLSKHVCRVVAVLSNLSVSESLEAKVELSRETVWSVSKWTTSSLLTKVPLPYVGCVMHPSTVFCEHGRKLWPIMLYNLAVCHPRTCMYKCELKTPAKTFQDEVPLLLPCTYAGDTTSILSHMKCHFSPLSNNKKNSKS